MDDVKKLQSVDVSSPDFVTNYALLMGAWMGAVTRLILPQIQTNLQVFIAVVTAILVFIDLREALGDIIHKSAS